METGAEQPTNIIVVIKPSESAEATRVEAVDDLSALGQLNRLLPNGTLRSALRECLDDSVLVDELLDTSAQKIRAQIQVFQGSFCDAKVHLLVGQTTEALVGR
jgi:hypothetical protein